jgi:hypothetical protein
MPQAYLEGEASKGTGYKVFSHISSWALQSKLLENPIQHPGKSSFIGVLLI